MSSSPDAAPLRTTAQWLLAYLKGEGVTHVFGVPGAGIAQLLIALRDEPAIEFVVCRHETGAAYLADGYHRATGRLGVVLTTSGPGATNALTGVMNANFGGSALLAITGEVAENVMGHGYLQDGTDSGLNVRDVFAASVRYSAAVTEASAAPTLIEQALRNALSLPRRAVHLSIPDNVMGEPVDPGRADALGQPPRAGMGRPLGRPDAGRRGPPPPAAYRTAPAGAEPSAVRQVLDTLLAARRPLILLGHGCRTALRDPDTARALRRLVERHGIPVVTTPGGKGLFPEDHPLSLRVYGFADCRWPKDWLLADAQGRRCDAVLVIGSSLGELATNKWNPMLLPEPASPSAPNSSAPNPSTPAPSVPGPFIQVDIDPGVIGRGFPVTHGIVAEAGAFLRLLWEFAPAWRPDPDAVAARLAAIAAIKAASPFAEPTQHAATAAPIEPAALLRVLCAHLPKDAMVLVDSGNCVGWGVHYGVAGPPQEWHSSLSMGPMGFAVGAVVGARLGAPHRRCVALVGDGAFLMHGSEVSTAQAHGVGAVWIVLVDHDLRMVTQGMAVYSHDPTGWEGRYGLGDPDLAAVARGLGADACVVDDPAMLDRILPQVWAGADAGRPQVVLARINRDSAPPYYLPPYA
ncbi:thiamine pyrophosphate-binding protein [Roseomonas sp. NAR14]|uniref:Thiamine pyrophosphate-binding protein n=1 Tax=Roseomonas acroporae TaxID=2937791 RepID=A0A9X1YB27_9PROT|nr:thiamine pyrophosphate-binding protein [Roseomonas acroporae]MCK8785660.1 thiamine pyrophosphate-binding protein [Roseomonas acroporae]